MSNSTQNTLRLILGDQLNHSHSWFDELNVEVIYVMMEMRQETDYAQHHIQKIVAFFAAMRAFAHHLRSLGHEVIYLTLDDPHNQQDLVKNLDHLIHTHSISHFSYQLPDEYRLDQQLKSFCQSLHISHSHVDTEHFLTKREELQQFFEGKKAVLDGKLLPVDSEKIWDIDGRGSTHFGQMELRRRKPQKASKTSSDPSTSPI